MSYNLVERARKLAKLPAFHRNGVGTATGRVTQEQFADFVFQVGNIGREIGSEMDSIKDRLHAALDENHKQSLIINQFERRQWATSVRDNVKQVAQTIELTKDDTKRLAEAVTSVS